jgi:hypothetical protein
MKYRYDLASGYALEGKAEQASHWLEEARKLGLNQYWCIEDDPIFDTINHHPNYKQVIEKMKAYIQRMRTKISEMGNS